MARTLAPGRLTKQDPGEAIRAAGIVAAYGNKAPFGDHFDQLLFEAHGYEHILGSAAQVAADFATITWDQVQQRFEDKAGALVTLEDYDRIAVIGSDVFTANMVIDNVAGLEMWHIGNTPGQGAGDPAFRMGDSGGGVPYKIVLGSGTSGCKLNLKTDKDFRSLLNFTHSAVSAADPYKARYIANQGVKNTIILNGNEIFNPCRAGEIVLLDTPPINPYYLRMNKQLFPYASGAGVTSETWFRDLNIALDGYRWNGSAFVETTSRFTVAGSAYLSQVSNANRFFTGMSSLTLDPRVHLRADPNGVSIAATADFVNGSNVVTFQGGAGNIKNNMRINGATAQGIPDGAAGTVVLRNINTATGTAEMWGGLSLVPVLAISTVNGIAVTLNNSGSAGGSHDEDYSQGHKHNTETIGVASGLLSATNGTGPSTALTRPANWTLATQTAPLVQSTSSITDGVNGTPRLHSQNQPKSSAGYYYYRV